jgi:hypothetical protein
MDENIRQNNDMSEFNAVAGNGDISQKFLADVYGYSEKDGKPTEKAKPQEKSAQHNDLDQFKILLGNEASADALDRLHGRKTSTLPGLEIVGGEKKTASRK